MNIKDYKDKKSKGLAEIVEAGGGYACTVKKYNVDDGSEVAPETISVDVKLLNKEKAAEIDGISSACCNRGYKRFREKEELILYIF